MILACACLASAAVSTALTAAVAARMVILARESVREIRRETRAELRAIWQATTTLTESARQRGATNAEYALAVRRQRLEDWCADTPHTQE